MNAMVRPGLNMTGLTNPTPLERVEAAQQVTSLARANILGRMGNTKALEETATKSAAAAAGTSATKAASSSAANDELGRDTFLQLLIAQIQNQDPLEPTSNEDMLAQLAQFSSLEQMENLTSSFEELSATMTQSSFVTASLLIGREVVGVGVSGELVSGTVSGVYSEENVSYLVVGEDSLALSAVQAVV
ncbi:MAG: hypothetical protein GY851_36630 [bacterium]|nr:hypothetical protein [bacterium]